MTLGDGFGGVVSVAWVLVAIAWAVVALRFVARPSTRLTGYGMLGSVAVIVAMFWLLGWVLSLVVRP